MSLTFVEIIRAAGKEKVNNLVTLLKVDSDKLDGDCYDEALKIAVEKNRRINAERLILAGAKNIDKILELAKQVDIKLMLLMVKAVLKDDYQFIVEIQKIKANKFFGEDSENPRNPADFEILNSKK